MDGTRKRGADGWRPDRSAIMKVQKREPTTGWTKTRRQQFLEELAMTCNATRAAAKVGMSLTGAYALRRRDAEFALLWNRAIDAGSERLHEMVLSRALGQRPSGDNPEEVRLDPVDDNAPEGTFDVALALKVLALDRRRVRAAEPGARAMTRGDLDVALMERLMKLGEVLARAPDAEERARADDALLEATVRRMMEAKPDGELEGEAA